MADKAYQCEFHGGQACANMRIVGLKTKQQTITEGVSSHAPTCIVLAVAMHRLSTLCTRYVYTQLGIV